MENKFQQIDQASVLSWEPCTLKINKLISSIYQFLGDEGWENVRENLDSAGSGQIPEMNEKLLFIEGMRCELLQPGKDWQKGRVKIKVSLEFCPDEPEIEAISENTTSESSLDDIRRKLNQVN
ncbi:MAG: KGK domain-containing protein [Calothrix sp. MO_192.B10]|nr:KGK domain-containing protein [Calothrix sp. MO_192.B10]